MVKITEKEGAYIIELKPENRTEINILKQIQTLTNELDEQEYWTIKKKEPSLDDGWKPVVTEKKEPEGKKSFKYPSGGNWEQSSLRGIDTEVPEAWLMDELPFK